jgi:hypothetical protein
VTYAKRDKATLPRIDRALKLIESDDPFYRMLARIRARDGPFLHDDPEPEDDARG